MGENRTSEKGIKASDPAIFCRLAAILLCVWLCAGAQGRAMTLGSLSEEISETGESEDAAQNSEAGIDDPETPAETAAQNSDLVMIRVEGKLEETDRAALLERINAIRREACEEGIDNPVNGIPLTPADYAPLQWSYALEEIAVLRAAESTILQDHVRPDGRECFSAAPEGVSYTMETLAWGFGSAAEAVEGWYSEKSSYLNADGKPAGHYMALINPENRYVGIADLRAQWQRDACAGAFGAGGSEGEPVRTEVNGEGESVWRIPLREDFLPSVIERALEVTAGRIFRAAQSVARG